MSVKSSGLYEKDVSSDASSAAIGAMVEEEEEVEENGKMVDVGNDRITR